MKKITANLNYISKLSFIIDGEIKTFHGKQNVKQLMITKPALQNIQRNPAHR
jgi:hypothetical protein